MRNGFGTRTPADRRRVALGALVMVAVIATVACGPAEPGPLDPLTATELVSAEFPRAEISISEVERRGETARARDPEFSFGDSEVTFLFAHDGAWELAGVEWEGETYSVADVRAYVDTLGLMSRLDEALAGFKQTLGDYPRGADAEGLRALVPEFFPDDVQLVDGWGKPLSYTYQDGAYALASPGVDGTFGTDDDIVLVSRG